MAAADDIRKAMKGVEDLFRKIKWKAEKPSGPVGYVTRKFVAFLDGKEIGYIMQRESPSGGGSARRFVVYHRGKQRDSTTSLANAKRAMAKNEYHNRAGLSLAATFSASFQGRLAAIRHKRSRDH